MDLERFKDVLDKPLEAGSLKGPTLTDIVQEVPKVENVEESLDAEDEETPTGGKKVRIPRSRLSKLTSEMETLRQEVQEAQSLRERLASLEAQLQHKDSTPLPDWWVASYGDDENSRRGYENQQRIMREEMQRTVREMEAQRLAEEQAREEQIEAIEESFDSQMDELEDTLGRTLTDNQKAEILDIVAEYSPQDNGQYVAYMPVSKAYDLWNKGSAVNQGKQEIARIASTASQGGGSAPQQTENVRDWRSKYRHLGL